MDDLKKTVSYVSQIVTPSRFEEGPTETFSDKQRCTAALYTWRGERNPPNVDIDTIAKNEAFIMEAGRFIEQRALEQTKVKFGDVIEDIHTEPPCVNLIQQAAYDMGDLSFNLTPYCAVFIDPYKKTLSESLYSHIVAVLDTRCSNEEGCYYKTHAFPHVNLIGPVAIGSYGCSIVTDILPACTSAIHVIELLETLLENLKRDQKDTSVGRVANKCIVCTLVNAASQRIKNSGGVENNDGTPSDLFLINTKKVLQTHYIQTRDYVGKRRCQNWNLGYKR
jgi:hypothetical protein